MKKLTLTLLLMLFSLGSYSYDAKGPATTVKYIYNAANGANPFILFDTGAMPGCYGDRGGYLPIANTGGADRTFSMVLAAYMSGKNVIVYYNYVNTDPNYSGWGKCHITAISLN